MSCAHCETLGRKNRGGVNKCVQRYAAGLCCGVCVAVVVDHDCGFWFCQRDARRIDGRGSAFLVKNHLHADVGMLGLLESVASFGSIIAALWFGRRVRIRQRGLKTYGAAIVLSLAVLGLGLPIPLVGVMLAAFSFGLSESVIGLIWTNTLQELVPRDLLGRVASVDEFGSFVLIPIGYGVARLGNRLDRRAARVRVFWRGEFMLVCSRCCIRRFEVSIDDSRRLNRRHARARRNDGSA